ncbi:MAG: hypothetical protein ABSA41_19190 [Terriglobia bacterium]
MVIEARKIEPRWNYLLAIERDLAELSRYVEFDKKNFGCFSIEIARILLSCGAEVDVVCKRVCREINPKSAADNIHTYRTEIKPRFPGISEFQVLLQRFGLRLTPWDEWKKANGVPVWWTAYNRVKHERDSEYDKASVKNALNALAGLFVMNLHLLEAKGQLGELLPSPQLLSVDAGHIGGRSFGGYDPRIRYVL